HDRLRLAQPAMLGVGYDRDRCARKTRAVRVDLYANGPSMPVATRSCTRCWNGGLDLYATPAAIRPGRSVAPARADAGEPARMAWTGRCRRRQVQIARASAAR